MKFHHRMLFCIPTGYSILALLPKIFCSTICNLLLSYALSFFFFLFLLTDGDALSILCILHLLPCLVMNSCHHMIPVRPMCGKVIQWGAAWLREYIRVFAQDTTSHQCTGVAHVPDGPLLAPLRLCAALNARPFSFRPPSWPIMKIVVTGASGLLGRAVFAQLKQDGHTVLGTALSRANPENGLVKLDLTNFDDFQEFLNKEEPQAIIHTAAERRPDVVERSPEASQILNVDVPSKIANWCKENAKSPLLINISTDYVFDGTSPPYKVDDSPNPLNAYGKSKWEGEKGVIQHGQAGRISNVRVPVLYGKTHTNDESAVNVLLNALTVGKGSDGKPKKMDANAVRYPTSVIDIAKALSQLCTKYAEPKNEGDHSTIPPTLHFSAMEAMTKYDMCLVMARCLRAVGEEAETEHLIPEYEVDPNAATSRPRHCKLDLSLTKEIGINTECTSFESVSRMESMISYILCLLLTLSSCSFSLCSVVVERISGRGTWSLKEA